VLHFGHVDVDKEDGCEKYLIDSPLGVSRMKLQWRCLSKLAREDPWNRDGNAGIQCESDASAYVSVCPYDFSPTITTFVTQTLRRVSSCWSLG